MSETKTGEWKAFVSEPYGWVYSSPEQADWDANINISIRRGSALPYLADPEDPESLRMPGDCNPADLFVEMDVDDAEPEVIAERWELAQRAAWGMNQPAEDRVCGATRRVSPDSTGRYICVLDPGHDGDHSSCPGNEESSWPRAAGSSSPGSVEATNHG